MAMSRQKFGLITKKLTFYSKLIHKYLPAKNLQTYQDILYSFKHPIGGGQQQKMCAKSSSL